MKALKIIYASIFLSICLIALSACTTEVSKENKIISSDNSKIKNGIKVVSKGIKVEQAFLLREDGSLIDESNRVNIKENILLRLIVSGWEEKNGKVNIGASETILTNTGETVLNEPDLFKDMGETAKEDAEYITLSAVITGIDKLYDYFEVNFKVWDKNNTKSELSGNYRFYIK